MGIVPEIEPYLSETEDVLTKEGKVFHNWINEYKISGSKSYLSSHMLVPAQVVFYGKLYKIEI